MSWTSDQAKALAERILSFSKAADCEVSLRLSETGHTRFAANEITTAGMVRNVSVTITSREGGKSGSTTTDELDDSLLREAVARSEALHGGRAARPRAGRKPRPAGLSHDPCVLTTPPQPPAQSRAATASRRLSTRPARNGLNASGFFETGARWLAIANKKGNFGFHSRPSPSTRPRCAPPTAPAQATRDWARRDWPISIPAALAERSANKAESSAKPRELAPGRYTVILEPEAVADLVVFLLFSLNARTADEGRSFLSKPGGGTRLGEKLFADGVTLRSDPFNPRNPGTPWAGFGGRGGRGGGGSGGEPARKTTWIENGVVKTLCRRPLLGQKDQCPVRPAFRRHDARRLGQAARRSDRRDQASPPRHPVLVHSLGQSAERDGHRPHSRRRLADRRRQDRSPGQ